MFYCDWQETFNALPNDKAGELIKHVLSYVNDENPESEDILINAVFANIKATLKRDLNKWEKKSVQNSLNAKKRWDAVASERIKQDANHADSDKDTVSDKVIVKDKVTIEYRMAEFKNSLQPYLETYGNEMLNNFYLYWTEKKPKGRKMLFEMQKTFDVSRRLKRWSDNNFSNNNQKKPKINAGTIIQQVIQENNGII